MLVQGGNVTDYTKLVLMLNNMALVRLSNIEVRSNLYL